MSGEWLHPESLSLRLKQIKKKSLLSKTSKHKWTHLLFCCAWNCCPEGSVVTSALSRDHGIKKCHCEKLEKHTNSINDWVDTHNTECACYRKIVWHIICKINATTSLPPGTLLFSFIFFLNFCHLFRCCVASSHLNLNSSKHWEGYACL